MHLKKTLIITFLAFVLFLGLRAIPTALAEEVTIGAIYPLSGEYIDAGLVYRDAVALAESIINEKHDLGLPFSETRGLPNHGGVRLKVVFADHKGDPELGRQAAERLIKDRGVLGLIGCYHSQVTAKASEVAEREHVPFLSGTSTAPQLTKRGFEWFFRTTPDDDLFAENFYQFLDGLKKKGINGLSRIGIFNENTIWGSEVADAELRNARQYGCQVVSTVQYPKNAGHFENEISLMMGAQPTVLFQASYLNDALLSIRTYKKMGFHPKAIIGMDAGFTDPEFIRGLESEAEYLFSREVWSPDLQETKPAIQIIAHLYKNKTGRQLNGTSARVFTAVMTMADALNRAKTLSREGVRKALEETNISEKDIIMPWEGIRFDPGTHQNTLGQGIIVQIQKGRYQTVWPFDLATKQVMWSSASNHF